MSEYMFEQLVDMAQVQQLLEAHHRLSGMACGLFDPDENLLVAVGWQEICVHFHRANPVSCARCHESDAYIKEHLHDFGGDFLEYRCKNGMIDVAMPIVIDGQHLATFLRDSFFTRTANPSPVFSSSRPRSLALIAKRISGRWSGFPCSVASMSATICCS